jgi:YaiO family outer membrane protein
MKKPAASLLSKTLFLVLGLSVCSALFAQADSLPNRFTVSYDHTHFSKQFADDWRVTSLEYSRQTGVGTVLGRVNYANRFAKSGWQAEGEAYPVISKKLYAFAGFSYANDLPVFPRWRTGSSLYYAFAKGWEAEGGFRYLRFDNSIWMGTTGFSKYVGAWLLNARSFFAVNAPFATQSFFVKAQRFLPNEKDYVWLQAGSGVSPDDSRSIQLNTEARLVSKRVSAGARLSITRQLLLTLQAGYARDEYKTKT